MIIDSFEIIDANGWDLLAEIPDCDYKFSENYPKFPINYLCGIKAKYKDVLYTTSYHRKPKVTLKISTWKGLCAEAVHYNGKLIIDLPEMENNTRPGHTVGCFGIPIFSNYTINLTTIVTQAEKDRWPQNYEYWGVGDPHRGFFSVKSVEAAGKGLFDKFFDEGWIFKIETPFR